MGELDNRPLLVLDLDETLLTTQQYNRPLPDIKPYQPAAFEIVDDSGSGSSKTVHVVVRPNAHQFLERVGTHYRLAIWSAAGRCYVQRLVAGLFPDSKFSFIWSREHCWIAYDQTTRDNTIFKPLIEISGIRLERTLALDDRVECAVENVENHVPIPSFQADHSDTDDCLLQLADFLEKHKDTPDFRQLSKENWLAPAPPDEIK